MKSYEQDEVFVTLSTINDQTKHLLEGGSVRKDSKNRIEEIGWFQFDEEQYEYELLVLDQEIGIVM